MENADEDVNDLSFDEDINEADFDFNVVEKAFEPIETNEKEEIEKNKIVQESIKDIKVEIGQVEFEEKENREGGVEETENKEGGVEETENKEILIEQREISIEEEVNEREFNEKEPEEQKT